MEDATFQNYRQANDLEQQYILGIPKLFYGDVGDITRAAANVIRKITQSRKFQDVLPTQYFAFKHDYWQDPNVFEIATILNWTGRPRLDKIKDQALEIRLRWRERCKIIGSEKKYVYETY